MTTDGKSALVVTAVPIDFDAETAVFGAKPMLKCIVASEIFARKFLGSFRLIEGDQNYTLRK